jgi:hypothetical protein
VDFYHAPRKEKMRYAIRTLRCVSLQKPRAATLKRLATMPPEFPSNNHVPDKAKALLAKYT